MSWSASRDVGPGGRVRRNGTCTAARRTPTRLAPRPEMKSALRETGSFFWKVLNDFFEHRCPSMAAALSYYTFFSLPPLLLLLMLMLGAIVDAGEVQRAMADQVRSLAGAAGAEQVEEIFAHLTDEDTRPPGLSIIGAVALLFGATTAFAELQGALNRVWSVERDPERGTLRNFVGRRLFSFGIVLVVAFLLVVSLAFSALLAALGAPLAALLPGDSPRLALFVVDLALSLVVTGLLFGAMFKVIPDAEVEWRDVRVGALATAVLFVVGKALIGVYLGGTDPGGAYGAAGSLALLLIWVYYTAMIVLLGAEITRTWEERYGAGVRPAAGAVEVVQEKRKVR